MSSIYSISYFATFVFVIDVVYFLSVLPPLKYSISLLKKKSAGTQKSIGKFVQSEETVFEDVDTNGPLNQEDDMGDADEQPDVEAITKDDWFKKPIRPPTPDLQWNKDKSVDNEPAHT
nr:hypothetical protein [Tanacetum cinerariifolium]